MTRIRLLLAVLICLVPIRISAQVLDIPPELLNPYQRTLTNTISFCVNGDSIAADFDRAVGKAIANELLLDVRLINIEHEGIVQDYLVPLDDQELYLHLYNKCDALLGWPLTTHLLLEYFAVTQPYYETGFVLVANDDKYKALEDIPRQLSIGTRLGSAGDSALNTYLSALPASRGWQRIPYADNRSLLDRVDAGNLAAAIIWEPALARAIEQQTQDSSRLAVISPQPLNRPTLEFAILVMANQSFLRTSLDNAIASLIETGEIDRLLDDSGIPGSAPSR